MGRKPRTNQPTKQTNKRVQIPRMITLFCIGYNREPLTSVTYSRWTPLNGHWCARSVTERMRWEVHPPCLTESEMFWNKGLTWWNSKRNLKSRSSINGVSRSRLWAGITCNISKHSLVCLSHSIYELQIVKVILQLWYNMVYIIIKGGNSVLYLVILYSSSIYSKKK